ncbi:hypothetical protein Tco_1307536, partial [Tanacetum coccineum]
GEYDMWKLRIEQYFQVQDYTLWDVIKNGNSFKPATQTTTNADGSSTTLIPGPVTADEKTQKKNITNEVNTAYGVSTANTQVSTASTQVSTTNLSDDTIYAFLARQESFFRKLVERLLSIEVTQLDMTSQRWSVSTVTSWETLQGNAEDLGIKITGAGIKIALEGL